ncbi:ATP synthase F0 subcomplex B subunit [Clostridium amylolyticum]|uniref:ATP synthase subunit b n=1 Tax=Clostridium amylolyticum TaxID=1121298 RepID=A0A1M6B919_9CLOT|nr:F0F1 ATP synthase subunit B [Clostridium amylolyticum]SHI45215.1 ATP synthase F0 subcomplex B subunit [Clostridium amylolyticum]
MNIDKSVVIESIINFIILYFIMSHFFFKRITKALKERRERIKNNIEKSQQDAAKARNLMLENEKLLKIAKEQGKAITEEYKENAEKVYNEIVEDAHNEADLIMQRANLEIKREREKAEEAVKSQVVDLAFEISLKALEGVIDEDQHRKLIKDFISKVGV